MTSTAKPPGPIHLDGTTLEGGGQLLRLALSLSSLIRTPGVTITDIRGKRGPRSKPGAAGGMKGAHLAGAEWLAKATEARTEGMVLKSRELIFQPRVDRSTGESSNDPAFWVDTTGVAKRSSSVWKDIVEDGKLVRRDSHIALTTPGSIFLVLQAILPYILFSSSVSTQGSSSGRAEDAAPVPVRLTMDGGTNVWHSLSYEYADQVLFPILCEKLGIGPITMTLHRRGWSSGRGCIGSVTFDIMPIHPGHPFPAFSLTDRGEVRRIHVSILASTTTARTMIREQVTLKILDRYPDVEILFPVDEDTSHLSRLYLLLVAETSNGYRLGRDWLYDEKLKDDHVQKAVTRLVARVVRELDGELAHGGCVDEFMQDQLVVFQALADGKSKVDGGESSLHTQTAHWVAESLLGINFKKGSCHGIGYKAGDQPWPKTVEPITELVKNDIAKLEIVDP